MEPVVIGLIIVFIILIVAIVYNIIVQGADTTTTPAPLKSLVTTTLPPTNRVTAFDLPDTSSTVPSEETKIIIELDDSPDTTNTPMGMNSNSGGTGTNSRPSGEKKTKIIIELDGATSEELKNKILSEKDKCDNPTEEQKKDIDFLNKCENINLLMDLGNLNKTERTTPKIQSSTDNFKDYNGNYLGSNSFTDYDNMSIENFEVKENFSVNTTTPMVIGNNTLLNTTFTLDKNFFEIRDIKDLLKSDPNKLKKFNFFVDFFKNGHLDSNEKKVYCDKTDLQLDYNINIIKNIVNINILLSLAGSNWHKSPRPGMEDSTLRRNEEIIFENLLNNEDLRKKVNSNDTLAFDEIIRNSSENSVFVQAKQIFSENVEQILELEIEGSTSGSEPLKLISTILFNSDEIEAEINMIYKFEKNNEMNLDLITIRFENDEWICNLYFGYNDSLDFEIELVKPNNEPVDLSNWSSDICSFTTNTQIPNNILIQNLLKDINNKIEKTLVANVKAFYRKIILNIHVFREFINDNNIDIQELQNSGFFFIDFIEKINTTTNNVNNDDNICINYSVAQYPNLKITNCKKDKIPENVLYILIMRLFIFEDNYLVDKFKDIYKILQVEFEYKILDIQNLGGKEFENFLDNLKFEKYANDDPNIFKDIIPAYDDIITEFDKYNRDYKDILFKYLNSLSVTSSLLFAQRLKIKKTNGVEINETLYSELNNKYFTKFIAILTQWLLCLSSSKDTLKITMEDYKIKSFREEYRRYNKKYDDTPEEEDITTPPPYKIITVKFNLLDLDNNKNLFFMDYNDETFNRPYDAFNKKYDISFENLLNLFKNNDNKQLLWNNNLNNILNNTTTSIGSVNPATKFYYLFNWILEENLNMYYVGGYTKTTVNTSFIDYESNQDKFSVLNDFFHYDYLDENYDENPEEEENLFLIEKNQPLKVLYYINFSEDSYVCAKGDDYRFYKNELFLVNKDDIIIPDIYYL